MADPCNALDAANFVQAHKFEADQLAAKLDVPTENLLGLAAEESRWGTGRIAREYNNYFSMHAPAPREIGSEPARGDPKVRVSKFESFLQSGESFIDRFGDCVRGKKDPKEFAEALVKCKFNSGNSKTG